MFKTSSEPSGLLSTLLRVLALRSPAKQQHSLRVASLAVRIGQRAGLSPTDLDRLRYGALLHDIGMVSVPDAIVNKPGALSREEWVVMRQHAPLGASLVALNPDAAEIAAIPHYHHERWDGSGYPDGLDGERIPLLARVTAVADVWDALLEDRPYRPHWTEAHARAYMLDQSGSHFDPWLVNVLFDEIEAVSSGNRATTENRSLTPDPRLLEDPRPPEDLCPQGDPFILGNKIALELATLLHRVVRLPWVQEDARLVARRLLARLARHYALLPMLWASAQGQVVDRSAFDVEWNSPPNQGYLMVMLEPDEVAVLASLLRSDTGRSASLALLAAALEGKQGSRL